MHPIKVYVACTGLGLTRRGYETFAEELAIFFRASSRSINIKLFGASQKDILTDVVKLPTLHRSYAVTKLLSKCIGVEAYSIEQFIFWIFLHPYILIEKPAVIIYSDFRLGTFLWKSKRLFHLKTKMIFANGAPNFPPFTRMDCVIQHLACHYENAIKSGELINCHHLVIPYGVRDGNSVPSAQMRKKLGIDESSKVVLSVGAINNSHKRMSYLIDEISKLPSNFYLIVLGQMSEESVGIISRAQELLSNRVIIRECTPAEVAEYYKIADYFVLTSLQEGLPRVLPEAMMYGLPCIVHDYDVTREVLGEYGFFVDVTKPNEVVNMITNLYQGKLKYSKDEISKYAISKYSWKVVGPEYMKLINSVL